MARFVQGRLNQCWRKLGLWEKMENVRQGFQVEGEVDGINGEWKDELVVQVLCKSFFQLNQ